MRIKARTHKHWQLYPPWWIWAQYRSYVKIDHVKTQNVKTEKFFKTKQYYIGEWDLQKNTKTIYSKEQKTQEKIDHNYRKKDINENVIWALKKLDMQYNPT